MEIDVKKMIEELGKSVSEETIKTLKDNEDTLKQLTKEELTHLFHYVTVGQDAALDGLVYTALMRGLTDKEFLEIRERTKEGFDAWEKMNSKKSKIVADLVSKIGKIAADMIFKQVVMSKII